MEKLSELTFFVIGKIGYTPTEAGKRLLELIDEYTNAAIVCESSDWPTNEMYKRVDEARDAMLYHLFRNSFEFAEIR